VSRITPLLQGEIVEDLKRNGRELSQLIAWLPSFGSRRT
jgi:hypothetical protein